MIIVRTSPISGNTNYKDIDITDEEYLRYINGEHIQRAFPNLSAGDREYILSGITNEEWNMLFPPEEE